MTTEIQRLESLGWKALDEGRQEDGRWCILATSCGHFIIAFAESRREAWSIVSSMALRLTREGLLRLPRLRLRFLPQPGWAGGRRSSQLLNAHGYGNCRTIWNAAAKEKKLA